MSAELSTPCVAADIRAPAGCVLAVQTGASAGTRRVLTEGHHVVGRAPHVDLVVAAPELSRRHFELSVLTIAYLAILLERARGNISRAAELAGIARSHLYRLLRKHQLTVAA